MHKRLILVLVLLLAATAMAEINSDSISISGHFLGVGNYLWQSNDTTSGTNERRQFDFAVNVDFKWKIHERIIGLAQLQSSPGRGSFGFPGPHIEFADLNMQFLFPKIRSTIIAGSFDTPIGLNTKYLTNNADATNNFFFLNSLLYSVLGGDAGTLNAVGVMGEWKSKYFELTASGFNGIYESSSNYDGYIGHCARGVVNIDEKIQASGSYFFSWDRSGQSQFSRNYKIYAWIVDFAGEVIKEFHLRGNYGVITFDDNNATNFDDVSVWQAEAAYRPISWHFAVRVSGWMPEDNNADGLNISSRIPNSGFALGQLSTAVLRDQSVIRYQIAAAIQVLAEFSLKAEYFRDDYQKLSNGENTDVDGLILLSQITF